MFVVQVWAIPAVNLAETLIIPGEPHAISIKSVSINAQESPQRPEFPAMLVETKADAIDFDNAMHRAFEPLRVVLNRFYFGLLARFQVFYARITPDSPAPGSTIKEVVFLGAPPGISYAESFIGYPQQLKIESALLSGPIPSETEAAISWLIVGIQNPDPMHRVISHWIGLECLAPLVAEPPRCPECRKEIKECPHCQKATDGPKATKTMSRYVKHELGVSNKEFDELYGLRCRISHGNLSADHTGATDAAKNAFRIQELLLNGIKKSLGWNVDGPPIVVGQGGTIAGVPGMGVSSVFDPSLRNRDQPGPLYY